MKAVTICWICVALVLSALLASVFLENESLILYNVVMLIITSWATGYVMLRGRDHQNPNRPGRKNQR